MKSFIAYLEEKKNQKIIDILFKHKIYGWISPSITGVKLENNHYLFDYIVQIYISLFYKNISLRPACFNCKYHGHYRYSDISIGDFWGIENLTSNKNKKGVSLVLTHSEKGNDLIKASQKKATISEFSTVDILNRIPIKPVKLMYDYNEFWNLYHMKGFDAISKRYLDNSLYMRIRFFMKKIIYRIIR